MSSSSNSNSGIGFKADSAATSDTGTFSLVALLKRLLGKLPTLVSGRIPVDGSGVTQPVSISSGGSTQYADGATAATPTGTVAMGNRSGVAKALALDSNGYLQVVSQDITNKIGTVGDTANTSGTLLQQLRYIGESLNRATTTTAINESVSGDRTIIAGTASKKIAISSLVFAVSGTASITIKDGTTAISGAIPLVEHAQSYREPIILGTANNFVLNISATANVRGYVIWYLI